MSSELPAQLSALRIRSEESVVLEIANPEVDEGWAGTPVSYQDVGLVVRRGKSATVEVLACDPAHRGVLRRRYPSKLFASKLEACENDEWVIRVPNRSFDVEVVGADQESLQRCGSHNLRLLHLANVVGEFVLASKGISLPILSVSTKLPGASPAHGVEALLEWVWDHHVAIIRESGGMTNLPLSVGRRRGRSPVQVLMHLEHLLEAGGVKQALQQLLFEPRYALRIDWPIVPVGQARCPALHGPRGPWTIPEAFDALGKIAKVQDRRPQRTINTLPMRLGKRLAWRIAEIARNLQTTLTNMNAVSLASRARRVLSFANQTVSHPEWEDLPITGALPLDSPQLHLDPVCQPLLRAWLQLESGIAFRDADEVLFRDPLRESFDLYEYAVWFALVRSLAKQATSVEQTNKRIEPANDAIQSAKIPEGLRSDFVLTDGRHASLRYNTTFAGKAGPEFTSWTREFRPDYVLTIDGTMHLLDAKYRVDRFNGFTQPQGDDIKVMHAYRDALRGPTNQRVGWAAVVYPGENTTLWHDPSGPGGVAAVPWSPNANADLSDWITKLVEAG